ncbi:Uncharacterised protein [uncultured archaeon]|nr:Uncharacterised protein [uncultured archaeon]
MKIRTLGFTLLSLVALNSKIPAQTNESYCLSLESQKESLNISNTNQFSNCGSNYLLTPKKFNPEIRMGFEKENFNLICSDKIDYKINLGLTLRF